ncbi:hypothetical protein D9O50_18275 [Oxalobacteraceae bacterium CAVE-383]|nr:hypothetical protein D9O50_18275 [Oxalobacteraceae bacterium CAVE-383]
MSMTVGQRPPLPAAAADARSRIEAQLARMQQYFHLERHADRTTLNDDVENMPHFVDLSNRRHPDLHLFIADSPSAMLQRIKIMPPEFHLRCVVRSSENTIGGAHHLYADIRREANRPLSILLIEPADFKYNQNGRSMVLALLILMMPDPYFAGRRMACFNAAAQMSGSDCLIFCIDFALKAHRHAEEFLALHAIHHGGRAVGNDAGDPVIDQNNLDTLSIAPAKLLPFAFFEHMQSRTFLREIFGADDPRVIEQIKKMGPPCGRSRSTVYAGDAVEKFMPSSIERCRRRFLLDTLAALNAAREGAQ